MEVAEAIAVEFETAAIPARLRGLRHLLDRRRLRRMPCHGLVGELRRITAGDQRHRREEKNLPHAQAMTRREPKLS
jgi:hypothetical protein